MTWLAVYLLTLLAISVIAAVWKLGKRKAWTPIRVRLHFSGDEPSIEGVLVERPGPFYRLEQVTVIETSDRQHEVPGRSWVPAGHVLWMQEV